MDKKVIFMGTPDFAVASLKQLIDDGINVVAVVTAPDRPSGRGQKINMSAVKKFALTQNLPILQPERFKNETFLNELKSYKADLFVVVAFRMLPEVVWSMPPLGTINLHGSLLPNYRGAAPINWAVINGEKETGVTTFFIEKEIDTGNIIDKEAICIKETDNAGTIHDKLMAVGAKLLSKTVKDILNGTVNSVPQTDLDLSEIKHAPKIFKPDCKIDWSEDTISIFNKIRGLSPYPTAWTTLVNIEDNTKEKTIKLFEVDYLVDTKKHSHQIKIENKKVLFGTSNGWIVLKNIQLEGKKKMTIEALMNGFDFENYKLK
ncbi:MAG TPA: methionyl-tRNA formyltransferase [Crocinitomix sp.]|nr:methionyl-tRNA formyltransferase [Crocinitomix sp.]